MEWISDHLLQFIIVIAGIIAFWIQKRREAAAEKRAAEDAMAQRMQRQAQRKYAGPVAHHDQESEDAERTRRIQEEIRRKIAERRAAEAGERPVVASPPVSRMPPPLPVESEPAHSHENAYATAEEEAARERQRQLAEQLAALEHQRAEALRQAREIAASKASASTSAASLAVPPVGSPVSLAASLRDHRSIRRAILLKEILDAPKSIRA